MVLLTGCFLAFFKSQRRLVGWIGWATAAVILVPYGFLFSKGISVGIPSLEELKFIIAIVLPPLVSIALILIGRRHARRIAVVSPDNEERGLTGAGITRCEGVPPSD